MAGTWGEINLTDSTVTYNGVTFGGGGAPQRSLPPKFRLSTSVVYDSSNRVRVGIKHTLSVQCIFDEVSQAAMATNMETLRDKLSQPAKKLEIRGLGLNLDAVTDKMGGPHPLGKPECRMLAENAWELLWTVEFTVNPCGSNVANWLAFNYTTDWSNDFEGRCTRSISGYYERVHIRDFNNPNTALDRADVDREGVAVTLPTGFRRIRNSWQESEDHKRMNFAVTDEQMAGTSLPVDVIDADGDDTFNTNPLTWAQSTVTMTRSYRVHPGKSNVTAGLVFLAEAMAKQASMSALLPESAIIPKSLTIRNGKFQSAQQTSASISWQITGCAEAFLSAGGLWKKAGTSTYTTWKDSVSSLWNNRGNAAISGNKDDDVIIDLCSGVNSAQIGRDSSTPPDPNPAGALAFTCPDVGANGGYISYDLRLRTNREDNQTRHRKAVTYEPTDSSGDPEAEASSGSVTLGGPDYSASSGDEHVIEYNGLPTNTVILRFTAYRYQKSPVMPEIKTVNGKDVVLKKQKMETTVAGNLMSCPVYASRGYRIYEVQDGGTAVKKVKTPGNPTLCSTNAISPNY